MAKWNLYKLANAIYPLVDEAEPFQELLDWFDTTYLEKYSSMMRGKLGLSIIQEPDKELIETLENVLQLTETDMTIFFRNLANISSSSKVNDARILLEPIQDAFYVLDEVKGEVLSQWHAWLTAYVDRLKFETVTDEERQVAMNKVNPKYVLRNYMAQLIIDEADKGDYALIDSVYRLLKNSV